MVLACFFATAFSCAGNTDENQVVLKKSTSQLSGDNTVKGEYLVTVNEGSNDAIISQAFSDYKVTSVRHIRKNTYLLKIENDPGIDVLKEIVDKSAFLIRIQPNYKYKIN